MRLEPIFRIVGLLLFCVALSMFVPLITACIYDEAVSGQAILISIIFTLLIGSIFFFFNKIDLESAGINHREGMAAVGIGWLSSCLIGALPYIFSGTISSPADAFFETCSGFTTTGATILTDIEILPKSILMWRSTTQWLGGMGIIVLFLAILPLLEIGGMQLFKAEVSGPTHDKIKPKMKDTAISLWKLYLLMTVSLILLLWLGNMSLFDAICHTFTTVSSGGFSTWNSSIAYYKSAYIHWVIIFFMFLTGANYALIYKNLQSKKSTLFSNGEFKFYFIIICCSGLLVSFFIYKNQYNSIEESLRAAFFQVISIMTTTGFATADYETWLPFPQLVLFTLFFVGGCVGSTAGGLKCMRVLLLIKYAYNELFYLVHPRAIRHVKLDKVIVVPDILVSISNFIIIYFVIFVLCSLIISTLGIDILTSLSAVASCLSCVGPAFGTVGPNENYAHLPILAKLVLSLAMLLGRLEFYAILILFVPEFWRR